MTAADDEKKQLEVEKFWNARPCDSDTSQPELLSKDYFAEIEKYRYSLQPHIADLLSRLDLQGTRVLEIGTGAGTDARAIVSHGGEYFGINVDAGSSDMTRTALEVFGVPGEVRHASALSIPYSDDSFDVVYSFGVLHHIPAVAGAVEEILRVLKPGGRLVIMLYNRNSVNYKVEIRYLRKWGLRLFRLPGTVAALERFGLPRSKIQRHLELSDSIGHISDEEWLSRNTDGPDNPYSRVFDEGETQSLLAGFEQIDQYVDFFDYRHWGLLGRLMPQSLRNFLGARWGWHRIVVCRKPAA